MVLVDRNYVGGERSMDAWTLFFMQPMFNQSWTFVCMGNYYPDMGKWFLVPSFTYIFSDAGPFSGFRADIAMKIYGGAKHKYAAIPENGLSHATDKRDSVILRLRYEF
jgi:hypothetical protein